MKVVLWLDNYPDKEFYMDMKIEGPEKLLEAEYDYIVCAVLEEGQAKIIKSQLVGLGVQETRILWKEPVIPPNEIFLKK